MFVAWVKLQFWHTRHNTLCLHSRKLQLGRNKVTILILKTMIHLKEYFILSFSLELVISHALTFTFQTLSCSLILITIYLFVYSLMLWCTNLFAYILYFTFHILYLGMISGLMVLSQRACSINHFHGWNW
jgi:hypothetical protein